MVFSGKTSFDNKQTVAWLLFGWGDRDVCTMKPAIIAEKMPFYGMRIRLRQLWSPRIATHQNRNRRRISGQCLDEFLITDFRLCHVQRPLRGGRIPVLGGFEEPKVSQRNTGKSR